MGNLLLFHDSSMHVFAKTLLFMFRRQRRGREGWGTGVIEKEEGAEMTEWEGTWVWICEKIDG